MGNLDHPDWRRYRSAERASEEGLWRMGIIWVVCGSFVAFIWLLVQDKGQMWILSLFLGHVLIFGAIVVAGLAALLVFNTVSGKGPPLSSPRFWLEALPIAIAAIAVLHYFSRMREPW